MSVQSIRQYWFSTQKFRQVSYLYTKHLRNIRFLRKTFQKYQISTQIIQNVIDLSHSIEKPFRLGPRHSKTIWCQWKIFVKILNVYAKHSKIIVFVRKTFKKNLILTQTFEKYRIFTRNFWKVSDFYWKHSRSIWFSCKTFEKIRACTQTIRNVLGFGPKHSRGSEFLAKYLKIMWFS